MTEYERINRRLEVKYFPKVMKAIQAKVSSLINKIKSDGLEAGMNYLRTDFGNFRLSKVVKEMYGEVGMRHARRSEVRLRKEVGKKSTHANIEVKRFGLSD